MNTEIPVRSTGLEVVKGVASGFTLNLLHLGLAWLLLFGPDFFSKVALVMIEGFGFLQLVYVLPLIFILLTNERANFAKGVGIAASIAFLLSATCWGLLITGKIKIF